LLATKGQISSRRRPSSQRACWRLSPAHVSPCHGVAPTWRSLRAARDLTPPTSSCSATTVVVSWGWSSSVGRSRVVAMTPGRMLLLLGLGFACTLDQNCSFRGGSMFGAGACSGSEVGWVLGESLAARLTMATHFGHCFPLWRHLSMHLLILPLWIFWVKTWSLFVVQQQHSLCRHPPSLEALPLKFPCHGARGRPSPSIGAACGCRRRLWSCCILRMAMELFVVPLHTSYSLMLVPTVWSLLRWIFDRRGLFSGGCFAYVIVRASLADALPPRSLWFFSPSYALQPLLSRLL
jgi:hypothetical protein